MKEYPSKNYTCLHLAISLCIATAIIFTAVFMLSTDSKLYIAVLSQLIAIIIVGFTYSMPFLRHQQSFAPMSHLPDLDKQLFKISIAGVVVSVLSPFVLPHGTMDLGSATNKTFSIVGIAALTVVPISIGVHSLLLLVARHIRPFRARSR
ncbi:hypothetical protein [Geomonas paludis]|uniref:Uncharacterized protein n=1 Tax=Geomonas paludis TaxID=2740185 RepID=A0A6V8MU38_9BACT|nr:hypothetical protein [Geomonas paludis]GFO63620.1 hypothetical protein GMPD_15390 [Geomonas paludis]